MCFYFLMVHTHDGYSHAQRPTRLHLCVELVQLCSTEDLQEGKHDSVSNQP